MPPRRYARDEHLFLLTGALYETVLEVTVVKPAGVMPHPGEVVVRDNAGKEHRIWPQQLHRPNDPAFLSYRDTLAERERARKLGRTTDVARLDHELHIMRIDMLEAHPFSGFNP